MSTDSHKNVSPLDAAIERLYAVFSKYPKPQGVTYSTHTSITEEDARAIRERPLKSLSGKDLSKYAMKALNTWGDADEFRYYLPRLFELLVRERGWVDESTLLLKLQSAEWRTWPDVEQRAVEDFVVTLWKALLAGEVKRPPLNYLALGAAYAGIPVGPLADMWRNTPGSAGAYHLADLITLERRDLLKDGSLGRDWPEEVRAALTELVHAPETRARLEEAFFKAENKDAEHMLSDALGILELMPPVSTP